MSENTLSPSVREFLTHLNSDNPLIPVLIDAIQDKKGTNIKVLDLKNIEEAVSDYFIICDVDSNIQMATIAENVEKRVREELKQKPFQFELGPTWTLIDYIDVVLHIFLREERKFYDLEGLWNDAALFELD